MKLFQDLSQFCTQFCARISKCLLNRTPELRKVQPPLRATLFDAASEQERSRETFHGAIDLFKQRDTRKRGSVEFIRAALKNMRPFGVHRDLESYRALVDIMPKVLTSYQGYLRIS